MTKRKGCFGGFVLVFMCGTLFMALASCRAENNIHDASGYFESREIVVSAEGTGKIISLAIEEGETLDTGVTAGRIDSTQLELRRKQLYASMRAADSRRVDLGIQISVIRQQITAAERERRRIEILLESDAATRKQLDDINAQIGLLEKQLEAQKSTLQKTNQSISREVESIEIQIEQVDDLIAKCVITSPISGTVIEKYMEEGEYAVTGRPVFMIADTGKMFLRSYITAELLTQITLGQDASVFADFGKGGMREYRGIVSWISEKAEFTPKTIQTGDERANLVYAVKIAVANDGYIKSGMYGEVKFER